PCARRIKRGRILRRSKTVSNSSSGKWRDCPPKVTSPGLRPVPSPAGQRWRLWRCCCSCIDGHTGAEKAPSASRAILVMASHTALGGAPRRKKAQRLKHRLEPCHWIILRTHPRHAQLRNTKTLGRCRRL